MLAGRPSSTLISAVFDEVLVETLFDPRMKVTALAVKERENLLVLPEWEQEGQRFLPVRADNNLLRHRAILLPSAVVDHGDTGSLFANITDYLGRYVALPPDDLAITATYILLSWLHDGLNELPYLRFRGEYGTGKSRALYVAGSIAYKPFFASGASTISPIFHTLDAFGGVLVLDEADFRFTDEKAELVKILNNGNVRGFPVLRTQQTSKREFDPRAFSVYGPKMVAMRGEYQDRALESRFVTIEMEPGRASGMPLSLPDVQQEEALDLRNKLLSFRFANRRSVAIDPSLADPDLEPRLNQVFLPLLSVAPTSDVRTAILRRARALASRIMADRSQSPEGEVVAALLALGGGGGEAITPLADVVALFRDRFGEGYERPITHRYVGGLLRRLGVQLYKSHGVTTIAPRQDERIAALGRRFGVGDIPGITDTF